MDAAYRAGAEIIKHQTHIPYDEMSEEAKKLNLEIQIKIFTKLLAVVL